MNIEQEKLIREKWLPMLRSGKYKQGRGSLHKLVDNDPQYCCLGVLCEALELGWSGKSDWDTEEGTEERFTPFKGDSASILSKEIGDMVGISPMGIFSPPLRNEDGGESYQVMSLTGLNDHLGWSFEKIADFIEGVLDGRLDYQFLDYTFRE